jgi:C_GCAxxG_C_C family probable redox protein
MAEQSSSVADVAARYFREGHNCAQAVLRAVAEAGGLSCPQCIPAVALAMGGGIAHTGRACGAVTGAVMVVGLAVDRFLGGPMAAKKPPAYRAAADLVNRFAAEFGSADCEAILGMSWADPGSMDRFRREGFMETKCVPCVRWAAEEAARIVADLRTNPHT